MKVAFFDSDNIITSVSSGPADMFAESLKDRTDYIELDEDTNIDFEYPQKVEDGKLVARTKPTDLQKAEFQQHLRKQRNSILKQSDWRLAVDSPMTTEQKTAWQTYRQQLRDLPASYTNEIDITKVTWPTEPS